MYFSFPFFFLAAGSSHTWEDMFYSGEQNRQGPETLVNSKLILTWPFSSLWIFKMMKCTSFPSLLNSPVMCWGDGAGAGRFNTQKGKRDLKGNLELGFKGYRCSSVHHSVRQSIHLFVVFTVVVKALEPASQPARIQNLPLLLKISVLVYKMSKVSICLSGCKKWIRSVCEELKLCAMVSINKLSINGSSNSIHVY